MRFKKKSDGMAEGDMTPMIDMTFQLIAFFMVLVNFTEAEQDARVKLPESALAKPPETTPDDFFTVQMDENANCIIDGRVDAVKNVGPLLSRKAEYYQAKGDVLADVIVIVRAHKEAPTGKVQDLVKACQQANFETFVLRAKESADF